MTYKAAVTLSESQTHEGSRTSDILFMYITHASLSRPVSFCSVPTNSYRMGDVSTCLVSLYLWLYLTLLVFTVNSALTSSHPSWSVYHTKRSPNINQSITFYLYSPYSQITICVVRLMTWTSNNNSIVTGPGTFITHNSNLNIYLNNIEICWNILATYMIHLTSIMFHFMCRCSSCGFKYFS